MNPLFLFLPDSICLPLTGPLEFVRILVRENLLMCTCVAGFQMGKMAAEKRVMCARGSVRIHCDRIETCFVNI